MTIKILSILGSTLLSTVDGETIIFSHADQSDVVFNGWIGMEYSLRRESRQYYTLRITGTSTEIISFDRIYPSNATWIAMYKVGDDAAWAKLEARLTKLTELNAMRDYDKDMKESIALLCRLAKHDVELTVAKAFSNFDERIKKI